MPFDDNLVQEDTLSAVFERAVAAYPLRTALRSRDAELTYEQLNIAANRIAQALIEHSHAPDDRIAILMQHDLPQIIALLGIVKAGRIAVALNPSHPVSRLRQIVDDADAAIVITDPANEALGGELTRADRSVLQYDGLAAYTSTANPPIRTCGHEAAALVYTSGSTGQPKAVVQTHRQLCRNIEIHTEAMHYCAADRLPLFGSISGGQGLTMAFIALRNGACLCPFPVTVKGVTGLAEWMADLGITVYASSASIFRNFLKTVDGDLKFPGVRAVRLSSEPATSDDFRMFQRHFPADCIFVHTFSSSETCNVAWSRRRTDDSVPEGRLPIGLPSRGQDVMILDASGDPVADGEVGEIAIRSKYVAAGYWRNDAATAEKFSAPLDQSGTRLVRTGDLGRINAEGLLEFIGRADDRVKIRGNRIELSEIESALHGIAGVRRAVVEPVAGDGREPLLVAFVSQEPGYAWSPAALRRAVRDKLPDYMVPSKFVSIDAFPFTPTGKIDREALRKADPSVIKTSMVDAPCTDMERFVAELWRESFELDDVGRRDNFFDLGGDSLVAAVMAARIHSAFGVEVELATFFDFPTLAELARVIETMGRVAVAAAIETSQARPTEFPASYSQESFWAIDGSHAPSLRTSRCSRIAGALDIAVLKRCINDLVGRHEMLRTTFADRNGELVQVVHPPPEAPLVFHDLSDETDPETKARDVWRTEQSKRANLGALPLVSFMLLKLKHDEHWFIFTVHWIVLDGLSLEIFFKELGELYAAHAQGMNPRLLQRPAPQYGDYAVWQRETFRSDGLRYRDSLTWWINEVLAASYPSRPGYRRALLWCMKALGRESGLLKQVIGFALRSVHSVPRPPRSELPYKRATRVDDVDPNEGAIFWGLSADVSKRLESLRRQERTSDYVIRLAAYIASLSMETGDPNVAVYVSLSNRARPTTRDVIGCCATAAILQLRCDGDMTFRQLLVSVKDRLRAMQARADVPYDRVHREMRAWRIKMPQGRAILSTAWTHAPVRCGDIEIVSLPDRNMTAPPLQFDTKFDMENEAENCSVLFDARSYDPEKVRGFIERFKAVLDQVSLAPDTRIGDALASIKGSPPA